MKLLEKTVSEEVVNCANRLRAEFASLGFEQEIKQRGFFGNVYRFSKHGVALFDILPAKNWIKFYFSKDATRNPRLSFEIVKLTLSDCEQRPKDLIVSARIRTQSDVESLIGLIRSARL